MLTQAVGKHTLIVRRLRPVLAVTVRFSPETYADRRSENFLSQQDFLKLHRPTYLFIYFEAPPVLPK